MITASIRELLKTGRLGPIVPGLDRRDIVHVLGEPEHNADSRSLLWQYGDLELEFHRKAPEVLSGFNIHGFDSIPRQFGPITLDPWFFQAGARLDESLLVMSKEGIQFKTQQVRGLAGQVYVTTCVSPCVRLQYLLESEGDWPAGLHGVWVRTTE